MSDIPEPVDQRSTLSYRLLRAVVIVLGALIVIALGVLVIGLVRNFTGHGPNGVPGSTASFSLPPGAIIVEMATQPGRVILRVRTSAGEEVDIVDTADGHLVGQIKAPK